MRKLAPYFAPYLLWLVVLVAFVYGQVTVTLSLPDYMADIVNKGIIGANNSYVLQIGIWMLFITLLGGLCTIGVSFTAARIATGGFYNSLYDSQFGDADQLTESPAKPVS